jgi:predicted homoserine dehydrogenase-like protein
LQATKPAKIIKRRATALPTPIPIVSVVDTFAECFVEVGGLVVVTTGRGQTQPLMFLTTPQKHQQFPLSLTMEIKLGNQSCKKYICFHESHKTNFYFLEVTVTLAIQ